MMRKVILSFIFSLAVLTPSLTHAQMFGGLEVGMFPCTCGFVYSAHIFAPLFIASAVPITGMLAALNGPTAFPYFVLHPGSWALGFFAPGVQACWMYVGWGCVPIAMLGAITPVTGVSLGAI